MARFLTALLVTVAVLTFPSVGSANTKCDKQHYANCRKALTYWKTAAHVAQREAAQQRQERIKYARNAKGYGVDHAIRLASALFGVPRWELDSVISCESGHDPTVVWNHTIVSNKDTTPLAVGLAQWLLSSWQRQGIPGFSRTDPYASVLAMARAVVRDNGFRQWNCKPHERVLH